MITCDSCGCKNGGLSENKVETIDICIDRQHHEEVQIEKDVCRPCLDKLIAFIEKGKYENE